MRAARVAALACLATAVFASGAGATRLIRVTLSPDRPVERLLERGLDVVDLKRGASADILVHPGDLEWLAGIGAAVVVIDDDVERHAAERAAGERAARPPAAPTRVRSAVRPDGVFRIESLPPFGAGSMGGFWTLDEVKMKLDQLVAGDTHDVVADKLDTLGTSLQGRPIWGLKIGRHVAGPDTRPVVLLNALTHAREPEGMQALFYFIDDLLGKADVDPFATYLLDQRVIYIVPVVNPDGYRFNQTISPSGGGLHRKNLRDTNHNSAADYRTDGVDLNRNFGYKWNLNNIGSSGTASSETYRGTAAFSEPETQVQRDLAILLHPRTGISFHTYQELFLHPWGWTTTGTPDSLAFYEWNDEAMAGNPSLSGCAPRVLYEVNGEFNDWMYGDTLAKPRAWTWTPEVGIDTDGFWPAPSRIEPLARENLRTCYTVAAIAGPYVRVESSALTEGALPAGGIAHLAVRARNLGLAGTPSGLAATAVALDPGTSVVPASLDYPTLASRTSGDAVGGATFTLAADDTITPGRLARFEVRFTAAGGYFSRDTVELALGIPIVLVVEPGNDLAQWSLTTTWGAVAGDAGHPSHFLADSPSGKYLANSDTPLQLAGTLDLSHGVHAWAQFEARWMFETAFDGTLVETTSDGSNWQPMAGRATTAGIHAPQPAGGPVYQGTCWGWKPERIDLSPVTGPISGAIGFRFRTVADAGTEFDGFDFDSLRIAIYDPAVQSSPTAVGDGAGRTFEFAPVRPNPARTLAHLAFTLPRAGTVRLEVVDLQGRSVRTLADGVYSARQWAVAWDLRDDGGRAVSPGVYFARLESAAGRAVRRLVVLP